MKYLKTTQILFLSASFLFSIATIASSQADSNKDNDDRYIIDLIAKLADRIYCAGEVSGVDINSFYKQENVTAKEITEYYNKHRETKAFTVKINNLTPLMLAVRNGYPDVLDALLKINAVKENINEKDRSGFTALDYAYYAFKISGPLYNPAMIENGFALVPYYVTLSCYIVYSTDNPYVRSIKVLKDNKAEGDANTFKNKIFKLMTKCPAHIKGKIMNSDDLIKTYIEIISDPKIGLKSMIAQAKNKNNSTAASVKR